MVEKRVSLEANNPENSHILLKQINTGIATLILNRPGRYNALSGELLSALQEARKVIDALIQKHKPEWN
jgi:enoyl-CoA hydratase/carnithine racemase